MPLNKVELSPTYYFDNFEHVLKTVCDYQQHLLSEEEKTHINEFKALDLNARLLWLRLLSRKGAMVRIDKLEYPEIESVEKGITNLNIAGFLELNPQLDALFWLDLLTLSELRRLFNSDKNLKRNDTLNELMDTYRDEKIRERIQLYTHAVAIKKSGFAATLRLLYFGNLYQDLSEFIVTKLGHVQYPKYEIDTNLLPFKSRDDVERAFKRFGFYEEMQDYFNRENSAPTTFVQKLMRDDYLSHAQWVKLGYKLERLEFYGEAKLCYLKSKLCPSRERLARISIKEENYSEAKTIVEEMLCDPIEDSEYYCARRIAKTLNKKGCAIYVDEDDFSTELIHVDVIETSPELSAIDYFSKKQIEAYWYENGLWLTLFGLFFHEVIFMKMDGSFLHPFQRAPLDLHKKEFFCKRQNQFNARLDELKGGNLQTILEKAYHENYNMASRLINWQIPLAPLKKITSLLSKESLLELMITLAKDIRARRSGFPDLVLINDSNIQLREVKGPGDSLRDNQRFWLNWYQRNGWDVGVINVRIK